MAGLYQYTIDGNRIRSITSPRVGDLAYFGNGEFLIAVTGAGVYRMTLQGSTLTDNGLIVDNTSRTTDTLGVTWDGTFIWTMTNETSIPAKSFVEQHKADGTLLARYRCTNDDSRDGLGWDGQRFFTWNRTPAPDELEEIVIRNGAADVYPINSGGFNSFTSVDCDQKFLWLMLNASSAGRPVIQTDKNGSSIQNWAHNVTNSQGVAWDGKYIWVSSA